MYLDLDRFEPSDPGNSRPLTRTAGNRCYIAENNGLIITQVDHNIRNLFDGSELVQGPDDKFRLAFLESSTGNVDVFRRQPSQYRFHRQVEQVKVCSIHCNAYFCLFPTLHLDSGNTGDFLKLAFDDVVGEGAKLK